MKYFLVSFFLISFKLFSQDFILEQIKTAIKQKEFAYGLSKIYRALEENPKDYRIYNLKAELLFSQEKIFDGLLELENSIEILAKQEEVLKILANKYYENNRISKSFKYALLYERLYPPSKEIFYLLSLTASQIENLNIYQKSLKKAELNLTSKENYNKILNNFNLLQENENFEEISKQCDKNQFEFFWSEKFHNICILAKNYIKAKNLDKFYLNRTVIFRNNPIYSFEYGLFLDIKKKKFQSVANLRRAYIYFLKNNNLKNIEQTLLTIQRYYFENKKIADKTAIIQLIQIIQKKDFNLEKLFAMLKRSNFNWELCYYTLKVSQDKNNSKYKNIILKNLSKKENSLENQDLFKFYSPFKKENYLSVLKII